jgi:hypothetical protein
VEAENATVTGEGEVGGGGQDKRGGGAGGVGGAAGHEPEEAQGETRGRRRTIWRRNGQP